MYEAADVSFESLSKIEFSWSDSTKKYDFILGPTFAVDKPTPVKVRGFCVCFPRKINFFHHSGDWMRSRPLGSRNVHDVAENELSMRSCGWNVTDYNKPIFDLINRGQILSMTVQRNVPRFWLGAICGSNLQFPVIYMAYMPSYMPDKNPPRRFKLRFRWFSRLIITINNANTKMFQSWRDAVQRRVSIEQKLWGGPMVQRIYYL